jgi:hypothetical protein
MILDVDEVLKQLDSVLAEYRALRERAKYDDLSDLGTGLDRIVTRLNAAVERVAPAGTSYRKEAATYLGQAPHVRLNPLVGIVGALRDDIAAGWLTSVTELLHADTLDDFLEMSDELLGSGYKDAAAVITGTVLESHLRLLASKHGISTTSANGSPKRADTLNAELVGNGVYNKLQQKLVTGWLGLRNAAAHGNYGYYTAEQVTALIPAVRGFVAANPA